MKKGTYSGEKSMQYISKCLWILSIVSLNVRLCADNDVKFTLWSGNCYAFPTKITSFLRGTSKVFGHEINLVSGIDKSIEQRIIDIAKLVLEKDPDVVGFQELWKNDNKALMERSLKPRYPHIYWISMSRFEELRIGKSVGKFLETLFTDPAKLGESETYMELNPLKMDSGLFLASKFPLLKSAYITYRDKAGDEVNANKGALAVLFKDRRNNPVLLALTHLQSWRDLEYVKIRHKQIRQLGEFLSSKDVQRTWALSVAPSRTIQVQWPGSGPVQDVAIGKEVVNLWNIKDLTTVIVGDFNDPITYEKDSRRLIDRITCFTGTLQKTGVHVFSTDLIAMLNKKLDIQEYVAIDEPDDMAIVTQRVGTNKAHTYVIKNAAAMGKKLGATNSLYGVLGRFYDTKDGKVLWSYFKDTTDAKGIQLLDPVLVDAKSFISKYDVLRKEVLGDQGEAKPYDPKVALSDHAHIMVEIQTKK